MKKPSGDEWRSKFAGAVDSRKVIKVHDANLAVIGGSNRSAHVIAPDGTFIWSHSSLTVQGDVTGALAGAKARQAAMAEK